MKILRQSDYSQVVELLGSDAYSRFGFSVLIANKKLIIGSPREHGFPLIEAGAIYVYTDVRAGPFRKVEASSRVGLFGHTLAGNADVVALSAPRESTDNTESSGVVHVYQNA